MRLGLQDRAPDSDPAACARPGQACRQSHSIWALQAWVAASRRWGGCHAFQTKTIYPSPYDTSWSQCAAGHRAWNAQGSLTQVRVDWRPAKPERRNAATGSSSWIDPEKVRFISKWRLKWIGSFLYPQRCATSIDLWSAKCLTISTFWVGSPWSS